jgi:nucleoside 2-deoxyribosyltransferase
MKNPIKIYLAGSIPKGDLERERWANWRVDYEAKIKAAVPTAIFLDPDLIRDTVGPELVVGHDLWQIQHSDIVVVNIPEKVGAGTSQEMVIAKYFGKPVVTVLPKDTHHRRSNIAFDGEMIADWVHPFIYISSDFIAESIDEAIPWMQSYIMDPESAAVKTMTVFDEVVQRFESELADVATEYEERGW